MHEYTTVESVDIEQQIAALIRRCEPRVPATRRLLANLQKVEEALTRGVSREALAEVYGLSLNQFAAALAGARRLYRQGGDGRKSEVKQGRRKASMVAGLQPAIPAADPSMIKQF